MMQVEINGETVEVDDDFNHVPDPLPQTYRLGKSTPWRRMTDDEAVNVKDQMSKQPVRMQMIYDAAAYLDTGDELFVQISNLLTALFGKARADELLAPE